LIPEQDAFIELLRAIESAAPAAVAESECLRPAVALRDERERCPREVRLAVVTDRQEPPLAGARRAQLHRGPGTLRAPADETDPERDAIGSGREQLLPFPPLRSTGPARGGVTDAEALQQRRRRRRACEPDRRELHWRTGGEERCGANCAIRVRLRSQEL